MKGFNLRAVSCPLPKSFDFGGLETKMLAELGQFPPSFKRLATMARELDLRPPVLGLLLETAYARRRDGARISPVHVWKRAASKLATVMFTAVELGRRGRNDLRVLKGDWAKSLSSRVSILGAGWQAFTAAIAAQEFNGGMGLISAAPTGGASGALPGTIWAVGRATNARENAQVEALFVAGLVGLVAFGRGPVSGAQAGCGSEIGVGAGMAAGAAAWLMGADWEEIEAAAALAAMNFIGIECSPERGCVEYPCVPRNGFAALCAIAAAEAACGGIKPPHDLDSTYDRIFGIGRLLPACLRETEDGVWMASALGRRGANEE